MSSRPDYFSLLPVFAAALGLLITLPIAIANIGASTSYGRWLLPAFFAVMLVLTIVVLVRRRAQRRRGGGGGGGAA